MVFLVHPPTCTRWLRALPVPVGQSFIVRTARPYVPVIRSYTYFHSSCRTLLSTKLSPVSSSTSISATTTSSWLDRLPASLHWTRPYFQLSRLDKPIGSWLLYWPCGRRVGKSTMLRWRLGIFFQPGLLPWRPILFHFPYLPQYINSPCSGLEQSLCVVPGVP